MSALRAFQDFLTGLFTRHLGTKVLSLILSVVLFGFVQKSLSGEATVAELTLRFEISSELAPNYVLMTRSVKLKDLVLIGLRSKVQATAASLSLQSAVRIGVDRRFLRSFGDYPPNRQILIPIDAEFFRRVPALLGEGIEASVIRESQALLLDPRVTVEFEVTLPAEIEAARTQIPEESSFKPVGDEKRLKVELQPRHVRIAGPQSALPGTEPGKFPPLFVEIPDIGEVLRSPYVEEAPAPNVLPVMRIDWAKSGVQGTGLEYATFLDPPAAGAEEFAKRVRFRFLVEARGQTEALTGIPIVFRWPTAQVPPGALLDTYTATANFELFEDDLRAGVCSRLVVSIPRHYLNRRAALQQKLVLVIDWNRKAEGDKDFEVPVFLDTRDPDDPDREELRSRIRIKSNGPPSITFYKRE